MKEKGADLLGLKIKLKNSAVLYLGKWYIVWVYKGIEIEGWLWLMNESRDFQRLLGLLTH